MDHVVIINGKHCCRYCGEEITTQAEDEAHQKCFMKEKKPTIDPKPF